MISLCSFLFEWEYNRKKSRMLRIETKGGDDSDGGEWPASPMQVLENAVMAAGEALQNVYSSTSRQLAHRRTQSEVTNPFHKRSNSIQRLKSHVQKTFRWGGHSCENSYSPSFNPEILANQKRQWYERYSKTPVSCSCCKKKDYCPMYLLI